MAVRGWYWRYESEFTGEDCVAVLTRSSNRKTGALTVQVWLLNEKVSPKDARGRDGQRAVCPAEDCPFFDGGCYVGIYAPLSVWKAYHRGLYVPLPEHISTAAIPESWCGLNVRFGAWGDPCSAPLAFVRHVIRLFRPRRWQAFTHYWRKCPPPWRDYAMASVEDPLSAHVARARGWKTFRVRTGGWLMPGESRCAAEAAGIKCQDCGRCGGRKARGIMNVAINVHGYNSRAAAEKCVNLL